VVNPWKIILATLGIFVAGLLVGAVGVRQLYRVNPPPAARPPVETPMLPQIVTEQFINRLAMQLHLPPEQRDRIWNEVKHSQDRIRELYSLIGPEVSEELQFVRESIRAHMTPEQAEQFEQFMRNQRLRRFDGTRPENQRMRPEGSFPGDGRGPQNFDGPRRPGAQGNPNFRPDPNGRPNPDFRPEPNNRPGDRRPGGQDELP